MTPPPDVQHTYAADGFYRVPEPVLSPELTADARAGIDEVRAGRYDTNRAPYPSPWQPGDDPDVLCKVELAHLANRALHEVAAHPSIGAWAAAITGAERVQVWWVQMLYKPPTSGRSAATSVGWHQDYQYWQHDWASSDGLLTAWIALSDVTAASGPVRFVPGSHHWGFRGEGDFFEQDSDAQRSALTLPDGETWNEVPAVLPPGGVSFHDCLTYHGSGANESDVPRCSLVLHLRTDQAQLCDGRPGPLTQNLDDPTVCPVLYPPLRDAR
jgi:ectoine hydroxylase-related dioxygenase (phytanoyl-CoA dioxygenase family)